MLEGYHLPGRNAADITLLLHIKDYAWLHIRFMHRNCHTHPASRDATYYY